MANANPYRDASPFGSASIGGVALAGVIQSIDGFRKPDEWTFQKGAGGNNAATIWKGTKLAESGTIKIALFDQDSYDAHEALRLVLRPKLGTKPPSLPIVNALINGNGVLVVVCVDAPSPTWVKAGGYWVADLMLAEYNPPKPAAAGQAGSAQNSAGPNAGAPPQTAGEKQLSGLLEEASKL